MYTYSRDRDGTDDVFAIHAPDGRVLATRTFWEEPDTDDAERAERDVRLIVAALNTCQGMSELLKVVDATA